jgi:hypothetical protein
LELDSALISILEKLGASAGIIVILVLLGVLVPGWVYRDLKAQNKLKDEEITAQRDRADQAVAALQDTKNVMAALQLGLQMGMAGGERPPLPTAEGPPP